MLILAIDQPNSDRVNYLEETICKIGRIDKLIKNVPILRKFNSIIS